MKKKQRDRDAAHMENVRGEISRKKKLGAARANARKAVNAFVRIRDEGLPCISCGEFKPHTAGHQRTVASSPEIQFDTRNINGQCSGCNSGQTKFKKDGTVKQKYDDGIIERFGQERLDWVYGPHPRIEYTLEQLQRIAALYRKRGRLYLKIRGD